jgi:hypothetical protein
MVFPAISSAECRPEKLAEITKTFVDHVQVTYSGLAIVPLLPIVPLFEINDLQSLLELGNRRKHIMRMSMGEPIGTLIH